MSHIACVRLSCWGGWYTIMFSQIYQGYIVNDNRDKEILFAWKGGEKNEKQ